MTSVHVTSPIDTLLTPRTGIASSLALLAGLKPRPRSRSLWRTALDRHVAERVHQSLLLLRRILLTLTGQPAEALFDLHHVRLPHQPEVARDLRDPQLKVF